MKFIENLDSPSYSNSKNQSETFNPLNAIDFLPAAIAYINKDLMYEFVNEKYCKFVKKSKNQIVGKYISNIIKKDNYIKIEGHIKKVLSGKSVSFDCYLDIDSKSSNFANCQYIPNVSETGELLGFYVYLQDITKQKQYDNLFDYLWKVSTNKHLDYKERIEKALYAARTYLEMDHGVITKIADMTCKIYVSSSENNAISENMEFGAQNSFCYTAYKASKTSEYTNSEIQHQKAYEGFPFQSYIGEAFYISGKKAGAISFLSSEKRQRPFSNRDRALISFIGRWIGALLSEKYEHSRLLSSQKKLSHLSQEYATILDSVPSFIWYKDTKNNILNANKAVLDSLNINRIDIAGKPSSQFYPETADVFFKNDLEVIKSGKPSFGILESFQNETNKKVWMKTDKIPLYNDIGDIDRILVISTDVTTEVESRARLEQKKRLIENAYQTTPALMHSINSKGEIELVSDEWLKNFGYERNEVLGRLSTSFLTGKGQKEAEKTINKALIENSPYVGTKNKLFEFRTKSGGIREVLISSFPERDSSGKITRLRAVLLDVTERNQLDRALRSSNKELEAFAYVASHDLQAPLRHVAVFTEILKEELEGLNLSQGALEAIAVILSGTKKMQNLISDLLIFSKANKTPLRIENFNVDEMVEDITQILKAEHNDIERFIFKSNLKNIRADKTQISQIFQNLIGNALKFSDKGINKRINISMQEHLDCWEFKVEDNGIGFDLLYKDKIFKLFQRLNNDSSYKGTGIGLSICKKVIDRHRGDIQVTSEKNKGTTFTFTIAKYLKTEGMNVIN